jgi:hypothetical protein
MNLLVSQNSRSLLRKDRDRQDHRGLHRCLRRIAGSFWPEMSVRLVACRLHPWVVNQDGSLSENVHIKISPSTGKYLAMLPLRTGVPCRATFDKNRKVNEALMGTSSFSAALFFTVQYKIDRQGQSYEKYPGTRRSSGGPASNEQLQSVVGSMCHLHACGSYNPGKGKWRWISMKSRTSRVAMGMP